MRFLSVFGLGYVGSVTAACMARIGHNVIGVDVNPIKVAALDGGRTPIVEAKIDELVAEGHRSRRLRATTDVAEAIANSEITFISVATPNQRNGKLDVSNIERVSLSIGNALRDKRPFHIVVVRSTVLPGTCENLVIPALERASGKKAGKDFAVCMNPEFMREGTAVADFDNPPFTVVGANDPAHAAAVRELYAGVSGAFFETSLPVAEMVKYVCNAFHALKIAFSNEVGTICRDLGIDTYATMKIVTSDTKLNISSAYLTPGFAFGGSCLPKDLRALTYRAKELDLDLPLLASILPSNNSHIERAVHSVLQTGKRKIGVLGLSFKTGTDDLRESPSVQVIKRLLGEGCRVEIWDPEVTLGRLIGSNKQFIEEVIPHVGALLCDDMDEVIRNCEVVLIATKSVPVATIESLLSGQTIIDLSRLDPVSAFASVGAGA